MNRVSKKWTAVVVALALLFVAGTAIAGDAPFNPGTEVGNWLTNNITALYVPVVGGLLLWFGLIKRNWSMVAVVTVAAGVAGLALFNTEAFRLKAQGIVSWLLNM